MVYQGSRDSGIRYSQVRSRGWMFSKPKVICQVYGKTGHNAL